MSWHLGGHRIAAIDRARAECIATCGELLQGRPAGRRTRARRPVPSLHLGPTHRRRPAPAAIRHHLNATRAAHQGARRP